jgi:hypothetical protein
MIFYTRNIYSYHNIIVVILQNGAQQNMDVEINCTIE